MKVALVHDYLNQYCGGERVLEAMAEIWPEAPIYTSLYDRKLMDSWLKIDPSRIKTNFVEKLPFSYSLNKHYFFLYPLAFQLTDTKDADVVISISSYAAKFVKAKKGSVHVAYVNTPPRFLYGYDQELTGLRHRSFDRYLEPIYKLVVPPMKHLLKRADQNSVKKVDFLVANSQEIKKRIAKDYQRDSFVIYPPVDTEKFKHQVPSTKQQNYYLVVSRLGGYKKIDIVIQAFNQLGKKLKIIGIGPELPKLKEAAKSNIEFLGRVSDAEMVKQMLACTALVFPTEEDFGIAPVEAMAAGKPVIAYRKGGALETVVEGKTGTFFDYQSPEAIIKAIRKFDPKKFSAEDCRRQASKFSKEEFQTKFKFFVEEARQAKTNGR